MGLFVKGGEAERAGIVQCPKEKAWGIFSICINMWWNAVKKTEPGSSLWYPVTGQEAMGTSRKK